MSQTSNKRNYTATFILDTRSHDGPVDTLIERITGVIQTMDGAVNETRNLGQKEFCRVTDRKNPTGTYVQFDISLPAEAANQLNAKFRLDKTVDRILLTA